MVRVKWRDRAPCCAECTAERMEQGPFPWLCMEHAVRRLRHGAK